MSKKITHDLPTRCIDPVMKCCQECTWGYCEYGDDVECSADLAGCCFESGCTLGFDQGRPEDNPTLDRAVIERYHRIYTGTFYERFVLGKWH